MNRNVSATPTPSNWPNRPGTVRWIAARVSLTGVEWTNAALTNSTGTTRATDRSESSPRSGWIHGGPSVVPVLFVSAAFVHSTPVRETRAAIQRTVPGRFGQLLGVGVALTFRFIPVVREDLRRIREAVLARGGERRPLRDRAGRITTLALARSMNRADRLSVALQARCFAWNPTLPRLSFAPVDYAVLALAAGLALSPLLWL